MSASRLVVFDCDGTLVDSQHMIVACMERAFAAQGLPWPGRAATLSIVGLSIPEAMLQLAPDASPAQYRVLGEDYRQAFFELRADPANAEPLYPGARAALTRLNESSGTVLGIATGKSRRGVNHLLEREKLLKTFATIQTADDAPSKPHPGMLLRAMAQTGAEAGATVMIGDTVFDIDMANAAGVRSIGVSWGYHGIAELARAGPDVIADSFDEVPGLVARLVGES